MGDVLLATAALRRVKELNPGCKIFFYTHIASVVSGLPFIDEVRPVAAAPPRKSIRLRYEDLIPVRRHIARIFGEILGVDVHDHRPSCVVDPQLLEHYRQEFHDLPRPWISLNRKAAGWTPNKAWPEVYWDELIGRLGQWSSVIETGKGAPCEQSPDSTPYLDLVGRLSLEQLTAVLAAVDMHVGPISGPVHLAAAFHTPSVVIYGGYEQPSCSSYPENINFYSAVPCAPCWLDKVCPFGQPCLHQITPLQVDHSAQTALGTEESRRQPTSGSANEEARPFIL